MPRIYGTVHHKLGTSLGAHARRLHNVLCEMRAELMHDPKVKRFRIICISDHICALERAYPEEFPAPDSPRRELDVARAVAEEDDDALSF